MLLLVKGGRLIQRRRHAAQHECISLDEFVILILPRLVGSIPVMRIVVEQGNIKRRFTQQWLLAVEKASVEYMLVKKELAKSEPLTIVMYQRKVLDLFHLTQVVWISRINTGPAFVLDFIV